MAKKTAKPKHKQKIFLIGKLFSRTTLIIVLFFLQIFIFIISLMYLSQVFYSYYILNLLATFVLIPIILGEKREHTYKFAWIITIVLIPILGAIIYIFIKFDRLPRHLKRNYKRQEEEIRDLQINDASILKALGKEDSRYRGLANFLANSSVFPTFKNNELSYYPSGEAALDDVLGALQAATKFIHIEFFIIKDGVFWRQIQEILVAKAAMGVEVRFLYDGTNEMFNVSRRWPQRLTEIGIETRVYDSPKSSFVHRQNYRNHRKTIIVDGLVAFTGGINLADEYINKEKRFGYWKDALVCVKGSAVNSFSLMFLSMWDLDAKTQLDKKDYLIEHPKNYATNNFVIPFGDCAVNDEDLGYRTYLEIINKSTNYCYVSSPYLVITRELINAFVFAAKRGVDVRILVPGIPDKKVPYWVGKTYYKELIAGGVKIYKYTPGFNHSKIFVSDDAIFTVGSTNLDFRSFFLSFENGLIGYDRDVAHFIKDDMLKAYAQSELIDEAARQKINPIIKLLGYIFRVFIPLL